MFMDWHKDMACAERMELSLQSRPWHKVSP